MFSKTSVAVLAGMAVAGSVLLSPAVVAAPTPGRAATWGYNGNGQLGNSTTTTATAPVAVNTTGPLAGKTVTAITAGSNHTCAIADGKAYCWGYNNYGQLGNNNTTTSTVPVPVDTTGVLSGKTVTAISAGGYHSCVVADSQAYCWGYNASGQLGNSSTANSSVPVAVNMAGVLAGKTITAISAGGVHSCVVADGRAYCWGSNNNGRLGNSSTTDSSVPVAVDTTGPLAGKTITAISGGSSLSCAVADGSAYCWGYNANGQLGNSSTTDSSVPVPVDTTGPLNGKTVTAITAGAYHSCAVAEGKAYCWGYNFTGQLGNNSTTSATVPVPVNTDGTLAGKTVTAITVGPGHTCAVADGRASCWGSNSSGQLGNNSTTNASVPSAVDTTGRLAGQTVTAITAGGSHMAVLAAAVPQPPTAVAGAAGDAKVTVSWSAPGEDGGSPVLEYVVTTIPGAASCTTNNTSCLVSGLTNGTGYTFTVTARNAIGTSTSSAPSVPVTPMAAITPQQPVAPVAPPGKVAGVKAVVRKGKVKITWKPVAASTSYRVRISKPGGKKYKSWKPTTRRVFTAKVRKGKKYRFQVAAFGAGGRGPTTTVRFKRT